MVYFKDEIEAEELDAGIDITDDDIKAAEAELSNGGAK